MGSVSCGRTVYEVGPPGIVDEREGFDMPMTAATRAMRHMLATVMRLWAMYKNE